MIGLLNYFKYDKTLADLVRSRSNVVAIDIKNNLVSNLSFGLFLSEISDLKDILDRAKKQNDHILKIYVFDQEGIVLSSTDESFKGQLMSTGRLRTLNEGANGKVTKCVDSEKIQTVDVCLDLENNFSQQIGGIYLESSKDYYRDKTATMFKHLLLSFILVLFVITALTAFWVFSVFQHTSHSFKRMNQKLMSLIKSENTPIPPEEMTIQAVSLVKIKQNDLEYHCDEFYQKAKETFTAIKQLELSNSSVNHSIIEEKTDAS
jgi:hypothetical protein